MLRLLKFSVILLLTCTAHAQPLPELIPYRKGNHWGFSDAAGNIRIKCIYRRVDPFKEGSALALNNYKYGTIDRNGKPLIPFRYSSLYFVSRNYAIVTVNNGDDNSYGVVNRNGKVILRPVYSYVQYANGYFIASIKNLLPSYYWKSNSWSRGSSRQQLFDSTGRRIGESFPRVNFFSQGWAVVKHTSGYSYMNMRGDFLNSRPFASASPFREGYAVVRTQERERECAMIDTTGKLYILDGIDQAGSFSEGLACVVIGKKAGYIDKNFKMVIPPVFENIRTGNKGFQNGFAQQTLQGENCIIDTRGNIRIKGGSIYLDTNFISVYKDDHTSLKLFSREGKLLNDSGYRSLSSFTNGYAVCHKVSPEGSILAGCIDSSGREVIPCRYKMLRIVSGGYCIFQDTSQYIGLMNMRGEVVLPEYYQTLSGFNSEGIAYAESRNGHSYLIDTCGTVRVELSHSRYVNNSNSEQPPGSIIPLRRKDFYSMSEFDIYGYVDMTGRKFFEGEMTPHQPPPVYGE
jgi:hypothetical protein